MPKVKINILTLFFFLTTVILVILQLAGKSGKQFKEYNSSTVMNRIPYVQELALVKHNYTGVISYKDYMKFLNINVPLTDKYFLLKYNGYIKAGVDFSRIKVETERDTTVHVSLPKPKILETVIDEKSVEVFNESENAFNPIKIPDYNANVRIYKYLCSYSKYPPLVCILKSEDRNHNNNESAPQTRKPDSSSLQLAENQQSFRGLFNRKELSEETQ